MEQLKDTYMVSAGDNSTGLNDFFGVKLKLEFM